MPGVVVTPSLERSLVQRRGIVTVPKEMASVNCDCAHRKRCSGLDVDGLSLEMRALELHLREMGNRFIQRMKARGYEIVGDLRLHGPWVSYEFNRTLADVEAHAWREAQRLEDPSLVLPFIIERDAGSPYSDYLLVGDFLARNVWTEVIVKED